jgi:hypothetical protein
MGRQHDRNWSRIVALFIAIAVAVSLQSVQHIPFWLGASAALVCYLATFFSLSFGVAALAARRYKRLGIPPVDSWPHNAY